MWTWAYPSVTEKEREFFIRKSGLAQMNLEDGNSQDDNFYLGLLSGQINGKWYYILPKIVSQQLNAKQVQIQLVWNPVKFTIKQD